MNTGDWLLDDVSLLYGVDDLYGVIVKKEVLVAENGADIVTVYDTVFVADNERDCIGVLVICCVSVPVFVTGAFAESVVDPVEDTVARRDAVPVVELVDVFDELIDFVLVTVLRIVPVRICELLDVLLTRNDTLRAGDALDEREDFIVELILELPVDVLLELIEDVIVALFLFVREDRIVAELEGDTVILFDGADVREFVDDSVAVLDDRTDREYVGLAVVVLLVLTEPVVVLEIANVLVKNAVELGVFDGA